MTHANIKSKLATLATTAGLSFFHYGYLDEFDADNRDGVYPSLIVIPVNRPLKTRTKDEFVLVEMEFFILNNWLRENATSREAVWDSCDTKALAFLQALDAGEDFQTLTPASIASEVFSHGLSTDNVIGVKYTATIKIFC